MVFYGMDTYVLVIAQEIETKSKSNETKEIIESNGFRFHKNADAARLTDQGTDHKASC